MAHKIISRKGHEHSETAQIYIHADQTIKQRALNRTTLPGIPPWPLPAARQASRLP
jgi:hypothetical protein